MKVAGESVPRSSFFVRPGRSSASAKRRAAYAGIACQPNHRRAPRLVVSLFRGALDGGPVGRRNPERAQGVSESAGVRQDEHTTRVQEHRVERQPGAQRLAGLGPQLLHDGMVTHPQGRATARERFVQPARGSRRCTPARPGRSDAAARTEPTSGGCTPNTIRERRRDGSRVARLPAGRRTTARRVNPAAGEQASAPGRPGPAATGPRSSQRCL